jgi:hypothetical protein
MGDVDQEQNGYLFFLANVHVLTLASVSLEFFFSFSFSYILFTLRLAMRPVVYNHDFHTKLFAQSMRLG